MSAPHTQKNISTIEAVHIHAARYGTNNYSSYARVFEMLTHLKWTSLNNRRESLKILMLYKIIQQLVDVPKSNLIPALDYYSMRSQETRYIHAFARTDVYYYSFPSAIRIWNSLPKEICDLQTSQSFKHAIDSLNFTGD